MKREDSGAELTVTKASDVERTPAGIVKRWLAELAIADETEKDWRKEAGNLWKKYEAEKAQASSFNIFWSNTEIMAAAVYNSTPQPDVRRRFRDADPVGKAAATVLERGLSYQIDDYDFDDTIDDVVLDVLIVGRGIPRIRYEPVFAPVTPAQPQAAPSPADQAGNPTPAPAAASPLEGDTPGKAGQAPAERLADEAVPCEHVQWDRFRRGPGKRWNEVPWISFEHDYTFDMAVDSFGEELAKELKYEHTGAADTAFTRTQDQEVKALFRVAKVFEIWDRETRRVLFIAPSYSAAPCKVDEDPLRLRNFYPIPRPVYAIRNSRRLEPTPLYRLYAEQAKELDNVSARINKITKALKVRGAYASALKELATVLESDDLDMTPIENPALIGEMGGLDKAIWLLPIEKLITALRGLYEARNEIKQAIYEIIGISDIMRGASDPNETLGAQQIKAQSGSVRTRKMQKEIQRVIRDIMRMKAEVMAERFSPAVLARMTNVQLPTGQQKAAAQQAVQQAQQAGQPPPKQAQEALAKPAWEEVMQLLRSEGLRQCRIDVETDSTVAETISRDMQGLAEVIGQVGTILGTVQQGVPVEVVKEIALAAVRRARMGSAVEDSLENFETPNPEDEMRQIAQQVIEIVRAESAKTQDTRAVIEQGQQAVMQTTQQLGAVGQAAAVQVSQIAPLVQGMFEAQQAVLAALGEIIRGVHAPKQVNFQRGASGEIVGASATPVVQ